MITLEMGVWLGIVVVVSVGMLLGIFALSNRINAIDERLFDVQRLEIALSRGLDVAVANESSQLTLIKLRLYQMKRQQDDMLRRLAHLSYSVDALPIQQIASLSLHRDELAI